LPTLRQAIAAAARRLQRARLVYGHGTTNALDEAVFLATEGLGLARLDQRLTPAQSRRLDALVVARIKTRKPAPYLVGRAYIQGVPFRIDERVIVPRSFIGELLFSGHFIDGFIGNPRRVRSVLDLCTGSGCLAILAAKVFPRARIDAVELSAEALAVAKLNVAAQRLGRRIRLHHGDLFAPVRGRRYDLILTNPPYVTAASMRCLPPEYRHEPRLALAGGRDGLDLVRRIIAAAPDYLTPDGALLCEIGAGRKALERAFPRLPFFWLDTAQSSGEVFWLSQAQMATARDNFKTRKARQIPG
jgi:ribosomal protein L3 glutamine methyltransferase